MLSSNEKFISKEIIKRVYEQDLEKDWDELLEFHSIHATKGEPKSLLYLGVLGILVCGGNKSQNEEALTLLQRSYTLGENQAKKLCDVLNIQKPAPDTISGSVKLSNQLKMSIFKSWNAPITKPNCIDQNLNLNESVDFVNDIMGQYLMMVSEGNLKQSEIVDENGNVLVDKNRRNSYEYSWNWNNLDPIILWFMKRISKTTNRPLSRAEHPMLAYYETGGWLEDHFDTHVELPENENELEDLERYGRREISVIFYINEDFNGGETTFPKCDTIVHPKNDKLIYWHNQLPDGKHNFYSLHRSERIKSGEKWIFVTWFREKSIKEQLQVIYST